MSDPDEAVIAVRAAKTTGLPVVGCMVYDSGRNKDRTMTGTTPEQAVLVLERAGADMIGANCGCGIEYYPAICRRLVAATSRPVWIKANAGLPDIVEGKAVYRMTPREFACHCVALRDAGAEYIGGCCGTSPAFIEAAGAACNAPGWWAACD
jgi:methionine synthase I (cobalamin-dependent)